jgi:hypothetical protein
MVRDPTKTRTMEMTIATMGRWMKNLDMESPARRVRDERLGIDS